MNQDTIEFQTALTGALKEATLERVAIINVEQAVEMRRSAATRLTVELTNVFKGEISGRAISLRDAIQVATEAGVGIELTYAAMKVRDLAFTNG